MQRKPSKRYLSAYSALYGEGSPIPQGKRRSSRKSKSRSLETGMQIRLVNWARTMNLPLMSIPNAGKRSLQDGSLQKAMGLRPGAADLFLTKPSGFYHGYWIELKSPGERPREEQQQFLDEMRAYGYKAEWFDDLEKAKESIVSYLKG